MFLFMLPAAYAQYKPAVTVVKNIISYQVARDATYTQTMEFQLRVDTESGVERAGEQKITYNSTLEAVEVLEAYTLRPNGQRVPVQADKIRTQDAVDSESGIYDDYKEKVIIFSQVEVGSQVYYRVRSTQHTPVFAGHFYDTHYFSPFYAHEQVEVHLSIDPSLKFQVALKGAEGGQVARLPQDRKNYVRYRWTYKSNTAYPTEPSRVDARDFSESLVISTFASWADVGRAFQDRAHPKAKVTPELKRLAQTLTEGAVTPADKVRRIYNWVSGKIRYLGIYVGAEGYVPHTAQSVLDHRYGDCKDHAVILEALLRAVDIDSSPVLIHSGESFNLPDVPTPYAFNHVINYVPSLNLYLDSTSRFAPMGTLPDDDMNKPVVHTATGQTHRTPIDQAAKDGTRTQVQMRMLGDGSVQGSATTHYMGYPEVDARATRFRQIHQPQERIVNQILSRFHETGTGEVTSPDPSDLDNAWFIQSQFQLDPMINVPGPSAFTIPNGISPSRLRSISTTSPVVTPRRFPAACGSVSHREDIELQLASNFQVQSIPTNVNYDQGPLRYEAFYELQDRTLKVRRFYSAERHKSVCNEVDEQQWSEFLSVLKRDMRQQVFVK
jgi:transglutaminase-like putative cysteine protease